MREQTERMVKGRRAAGVAKRGHSREIFRIRNQQDLMPLLVGGRRERRVKDASQVPPTELEKTGIVHLGGGWVGTERDEGLLLRQAAFEEPMDNRGISTEQGDLARGKVRAHCVVKR